MNDKIRSISILAIILFSITYSSCNRAPESQGEEYYTFGEASILADESLYPIVDDEHQVFANNYKRAKINIIYQPMKDAITTFINDSINVAVLPRLLKPEEAKYFDDRKIKIRATKFATDGIALITSIQNPDSQITVEDIKAILSGKSNKQQVIVFDNPKSSILEYLMNLANVKALPKDFIYALKTSNDVLKFVEENPKAIGVLSVSWIKRPLPEMEETIKNIKVLAVKGDQGNYELPTQSNLKTRNYPLLRDLYLIDCQGKAGLGTGFAAFLASDVGQRIILKSGLAPDSLPSRQINVISN